MDNNCVCINCHLWLRPTGIWRNRRGHRLTGSPIPVAHRSSPRPGPRRVDSEASGASSGPTSMHSFDHLSEETPTFTVIETVYDRRLQHHYRQSSSKEQNIGDVQEALSSNWTVDKMDKHRWYSIHNSNTSIHSSRKKTNCTHCEDVLRAVIVISPLNFFTIKYFLMARIQMRAFSHLQNHH